MKRIHCIADEIYRNKKTNHKYLSKEDMEADVKNPYSQTTADDIVTDVVVTVPPEALKIISKTKK